MVRGPGGSMGSEWVRHDSVTENTECFIHRHGHPHSRVSIQVLCHSKGDSKAEIGGYVIMIDRRTWFRTNPLREEKVGHFPPITVLAGSGLLLAHQLALPCFQTEHTFIAIWMLSTETHRKLSCMPESLWLQEGQGIWAGHHKMEHILCMFVNLDAIYYVLG